MKKRSNKSILMKNGEVRPLTKEDERHITLIPLRDVFPELAKFSEERLGAGRPKKEVTATSIHLRIDPETLAAFKATGKGWQTRIKQVLNDYADKHLPH